MTQRARRLSCVVAVAAAALSAMGCGVKPASMPRWQDTVHQYIEQPGGGDPTILRDAAWRGDEPGFTLLGSADPRHTTDVNGILLDHQVIDGRPWFVFLTGTVRHGNVRDIRVMAMSVDADGYTWHTSRRDRQAYHTYRDYNAHLADERIKDRRSTPPGYAGFPREADRFDVTIAPGPLVVAVHRASGARWEVLLKAPKGAPGPEPSAETLAQR
jgi:hypothetical protein